ncbi:hypothetical protein GCM10027036_07860 [Flavihumibacter cheonanensis]|uniref:hypothetical protein n=1 Tax=Flavihumibacter cheonanensis TaxID=1442385 RepID=UPI001EF94902|nr:hypothetical protein [Flavihumibacter cheonanensis]MCG7751772.1 hypothetical protein [Flavihumibacter cheonanensis]
MLKFVVIIAITICSSTAIAQFPYSEIFHAGATNITYTASKNGSKYILQISGGATGRLEKKTTDPHSFFYHAIKTDLDKRFGNDASLVPQIYVFAEKFAKRAKPTNTTTSKSDRMLDLGAFEVSEFVLANGTYTYALIDKNGVVAPLNILSAVTGGVYKYNNAGISSSNVIKDNFVVIKTFIQANQKIKVPQVSIKKDQSTGTDQLYFENSDGSVEYINLTPVQAKDFKEKDPDNKSSAGNNTSAASPTIKTTSVENKNPVRLLEPQLIACAGKVSFELTLLSYPNADGDSLQLEINTKNAKKLDSIHQQIGLVEFKRKIIENAEVKKLDCADSLMSPSLDVFYAKFSEVLKYKKSQSVNQKLLDTANKLLTEFRTIINNRIDALATEKGYSARIQLQDSMIPINIDCGDEFQQQEKAAIPKLKIDSLVIRVENNLIYQIDIVGRLNGRPIQTISNNNYGLALRELIDWPSSISFYEGGVKYWICYRNLVFVRPADGDAINYSIADGVYTLVPKKQESQLLLQKPLLDFVSASVFLDLQAFNEKNPNKNLLTELYFNFNINNHRLQLEKLPWLKKITLFRQLYTNITLATNIFKEPNSLPTYRNREFITRDSTRIDTATVPPFYRYDSLFNNKYYLKHFDLVRHSFFQVKPALTILSLDYKEARTFFEFNTGLMLMGSNVRVIDPNLGRDSLTSTPIFSFSPLYELRGRISPKPRFGIDMHLLYVPNLRLLNETYQSITGSYDAETLVKAKMTNENKTGYIQGEMNFFFNPRSNPSPTDRGGLYFKLNIFKATQKPDGFFMFLVGYSTDIKNFFK